MSDLVKRLQAASHRARDRGEDYLILLEAADALEAVRPAAKNWGQQLAKAHSDIDRLLDLLDEARTLLREIRDTIDADHSWPGHTHSQVIAADVLLKKLGARDE